MPAPETPDEEALEFTVSAEDQQAFASLSGDHNPLHLDHGFARARGFAGPVVYGGMIVAKISQIIGMRLPGPDGVWSALKIDFRSALIVGEAALLSINVTHRSDAARTLLLSIRVSCAGRTIANGTAMATYHRDAP